MKDISLLTRLKNNLFYCGADRDEFRQIHGQVEAANLKALRYWSVLVSLFWIYCICMSFYAADYAVCRPAYIAALSACIVSFFCAGFVVPRFPSTLALFKFFFRMSLLGGGVGIAVCQWDVRSLTMFAVAIVSPSIFIDSMAASLAVHCSALVLYIVLGRNTISPDIYYWGLNNFMLFSVFGFLIGGAINRERFERYVFAESEKKLAEVQMRYAYYDRLTGLKNRHAYEDKLLGLAQDTPPEFCVVMADINGLKETNDTLGHKAGDELIIGAAECLTAAFEGAGTIYRIGGDEFGVILIGPIEKAEQCIAELEARSSAWRGSYISGVSISTGVASNKDHGDIESVLLEADNRMYANKQGHYLDQGIIRSYH